MNIETVLKFFRLAGTLLALPFTYLTLRRRKVDPVVAHAAQSNEQTVKRLRRPNLLRVK